MTRKCLVGGGACGKAGTIRRHKLQIATRRFGLDSFGGAARKPEDDRRYKTRREYFRTAAAVTLDAGGGGH